MTQPTPPQPPPPPTPLGLLKSYFGPLLAGLLVFRIVALCILLLLSIPLPTDITFPEGALVARALDVAHGASPYHDWRQWPHAFAPYPPLAYYPVGWLARFSSPDPSPHAVYVIGRTFSCLTLLGIFAVLYLLGRRLGLSPVWSLVAVSLLAEFRPLLDYCASYRPDAPKTFFALLALWLAARAASRPRWPAITAALACLLVSAWFKPAAWGAGVALALWLWRRLGPRRAALFGAAFLAAGFLPLLWLNHHWRGLLLLNIVDSLRNGFSLEGFQRNALRAYLAPAVIALVGLGCALAGLRRPAPDGRRLILAAVPLALAASLFQMLKAGSDINYFLDSFPLAALAAVWGVARLWHGGWGLPPAARGFLIGAVILPLALFSAGIDLFLLRTDDFPRTLRLWREPAIERLVRQIPGPILATNPFLALTHPEPSILDYYQYSILCRRGAIDPRPLLDRVRAGAFSAIILTDQVRHLNETRSPDRSELYCKEFPAALDQNYRLWKQVGNYFYIYIPAPKVERAAVK